MSAAEFIKTLARREGFDLVGIARAVPLDVEAARLNDWLSRGHHASMEWMATKREKRIDPTKAFAGAKSVVSLAKNYYSPGKHAEGAAKISRYAWGDDYHIIIDGMLKRLAANLKSEFPENHFIYYCDTGPVMDKVWAQRAGIGWIGKHTNSINTGIGSWYFISEIITDLQCEYDSPALDHCGECRECIDACPTRALDEPYVLDSNKCISFLTIENREESIPGELVPQLENWIFGCDICQEVCPWNRKFQTPTDEMRFVPRDGILNLRAGDAHLISEKDFSEKFAGSPVKRAKHKGFIRNAEAILNSKK